MNESRLLSRTLLFVPGYSSQGEGKLCRFIIIKVIPKNRMKIDLFWFICFCFSKIDVYSFGVFLCEMCTCRQFPDPQKCLAQVNMVADHGLRELVRRCLKTNPREGPDMAEIISELERLRWNGYLGHSLFIRSVRNMPGFASSPEACCRETCVYLVLSVMVQNFAERLF